MPDPVTLADVRVYIEQRIQERRANVRRHADNPSIVRQEAHVVTELDRVLKMLERIEQRNQAAVEIMETLVDQERERRK